MQSSTSRVLTACLLGLAFLASPIARAAQPGTVAQIGDKTITESEVLESAREQLDQVELQLLQCKSTYQQNRHQAVENFTRDLVHRRVVEAEAKARNITPEALLATVTPKQVAEADIDRFHEENKARIPQGMSKTDVAPQIRLYLEQENRNAALQTFYGELEKKHQVRYLLEPLRADVAATGPSRGPASAPVTIVEFSDFECPFCQRFNPSLEQVRKEFGDKVRIVFRQFPLATIHANAQKAAEASLCADEQGKFWEMHDVLFTDRSRLPVAELKKAAGTLKLDQKKFDLCLDSGKFAEQIRRDIREGSQAGVTGTPAVFINGRPFSGAVPFEDLAKVIREELSRTATN